MTERATESGVETTRVQLELLVMHPDGPNESTWTEIMIRVQHMLNDLDREAGADVVLNENGHYGPKTADRIKKFQLANSISPAKGHMGNKTWTVLLQQWLPVGHAD